MVRQHSQVLNFLIGLGDVLVIAAAWWVSYALRFKFFDVANEMPTARTVATNLIVTILVSLIVLVGSGLYRPRRDKSFLLELGLIIRTAAVTWVMLIVVLYFTSVNWFSRGMLMIFLPTMIAGLTLERGMIRMILRQLRRQGWNLRHALVVGTGRLGQSTMLKLHRNSWTGIRIMGFIETPEDGKVAGVRTQVRGVPVLGEVKNLRAIVESQPVDSVFVALPTKQGELMRKVISELEQTHVDVRIIPDLFLSRFPTTVTFTELDGLPIMTLRENPLAGWPSIYKRVFDVGGAVFGLVLFALPMVAIAIAIKLHDGGPIFYRQRRISYGRQAFNMLKFRTMSAQAESGGPAFAQPDDPRVTRLGKRLRSLSLDELPQLFNVITGDMSLVGPRPERPEMMEKLKEEVHGFPQRLKVRAGMTGWAQVNGYRGRTSFRKRLQYDLYYLNNWSPYFDLQIVVGTVFRGFRHPNAY